ncbi:MAG: ZIP family metal transporter [Candidatus Saccharimonadales bacterium]
MNDYILLIFFALIGGVFSLIGGIILLSRKNSMNSLVTYATPFAAGALLAAVFLDLLPEGIAEGNANTVLLATLIGILLFFIAERFLRWFHHHHDDDAKTDPSVSLIIAGDTIHNALDGVAIAAAFLVSVPTGIVTTMAVAAHEIPQEIGDFGLLLAKGVSRKKVLIVNILSALATVVAAVITYALGSADDLPLGVLLGLSAGFLLYIALSDIIPTIHAKTDASKLIQVQTVLLLVGVIVVGLVVHLLHDYIDVEHEPTHSISEHAH